MNNISFDLYGGVEELNNQNRSFGDENNSFGGSFKTIIEMNQETEQESTSSVSDLPRGTDSSKLRLETKTKPKASMTKTVLSNPKVKTKTKKANGRLRKRKMRKNIQIKGLDAIDFLHDRTLLSTASKGSGLKSPPPPGCVDYKFTALTSMAANTVPIHSELPPATYDTPYALQVLLDMYREQFLAMTHQMKSDDFRKNVEIQIIEEKEKKQKLDAKLEQLEKQIHQLISDSLKLLKTRMAELGITNGYNPKDLVAKAKEIMSHHHDLQGKAVQLNHQIPFLEEEGAQYGDLSSKFQVPFSPAFSDDESQSCAMISTQQVKSEPLEDDNNGNLSAPKSECQLSQVDCSVGMPNVEVSKADLHITPFSIVLPRIEDVPHSLLLTPAQKKFANNESQIITHTRDTLTETFALNNENKPPPGKHSSTHRHRHKKSHKSKRKHKRRGLPVQSEEKEVKLAIYSTMIPDSIEDIITRTLDNNSGSSYTTRKSPAIISPTISNLNFNFTNHGDDDKVNPTDYRRVPPMKIALKKFVLENSNLHSSHDSSVMKTTIGDLVSGEIEKSLEISNCSATNQFSAPIDNKIVDNRSTRKSRPKHSNNQQEEKYNTGRYNQPSSKSPFLTPTKEEPFEGLAASMLGVVNLRRSFDADISRYSSPCCTPSVNLELKMSESNIVPKCRCSTFNSASRFPSEPTSFIDEKDQDHDNRWEDVSTRFDRVFEFVSNKLDSYENVPYKDKYQSKHKDSITNKQSPTFALNPPPLFRADFSFPYLPPMPDLPISPASLEGPYSPVPSLSPPMLSSPISTTDVESKD